MTMITMQTGNNTYLNKNSPEGIVKHPIHQYFHSRFLILIVETNDPLNPRYQLIWTGWKAISGSSRTLPVHQASWISSKVE